MTFIDDRSVLARTALPPDETVRFGELDENIADVWHDKHSHAKQKPLVILIHGGFWRPAFDRIHTRPMANAIAEAGWTVAAIEYRRVPGNANATFADVKLAIEKVPSLTQHHNGKAVVIGHSAGGHLALWSAVMCASNLCGAIALGPAADLQYGYDHNIGDGAVKAFLGSAPSEHANVDPCAMPSPSIETTVIHGVQDAIAPIAMAENYANKHRGTQLLRLDQCGHFGVIDPASTAWRHVIEVLNRLSA